MNNKTKLIIGGVIIAIVSFFAGVKYDQGQKATSSIRGGAFQMSNTGLSGASRGTRTGAGLNGATGSIVSKDSTSITLGLRDGSGSKIILLSPSTMFTKTIDGTSSDLIVGKDVSVTGTANPDGSINAQSVQIRPAFATSTPK